MRPGDAQPLPAHLRREPLLEVTAGIVAHRDHPLQSARPTPADLVRSPWLDCYATERAGAGERGPTLGAVLERLRERTGERAGPVVRAGAAGLLLLAEGPWLSWLPLSFLARLTGQVLDAVEARLAAPRRAGGRMSVVGYSLAARSGAGTGAETPAQATAGDRATVAALGGWMDGARTGRPQALRERRWAGRSRSRWRLRATRS